MHPSHRLKPEDLLHFVELDGFRDDWESLGLDAEDDLLALQISIMSDPEGGPHIRGTGGLRKFRFAPPRWETGKSGAVRVCYVYFKSYWTVLLVTAYGKNEKEDISDSDKEGIRHYIAQCEKWLSTRAYT